MRVWMYLVVFAVLAQLTNIIVALFFRLLILDDCASDAAFLPIAFQFCLGGFGRFNVIGFVLQFMITLTWAVFSTTLTYCETDSGIVIGLALGVSLIVGWPLINILRTKNRHTHLLFREFLETYCDETFYVKPEFLK